MFAARAGDGDKGGFVIIDDMAVERILLRHSDRGIDAVADWLGTGYCRRAAEALWACRRGAVILATGFPVGQTYETDGPIGAAAIYEALEVLGFEPWFVAAPPVAFALADRYRVRQFPIVAAAATAAPAQALLDDLKPVAMLAVERPGESADGCYYNMRHEDISPRVAKLSELFKMADCLTIGIGDGGNEIGMGLALPALAGLAIKPCITATTHLIAATTSNWGAYGLLAYLQALSGQGLLDAIDEPGLFEFFLRRHAVDGCTLRCEKTVDGHPLERTEEILQQLRGAIAAAG